MKTFTFTRGAALTGALMLIHAGSALAAGGENTPLNLSGTGTGTPSHTSVGGGSSIVRTIVGLFVVIVVIYGVAWFLRRFRSDRGRATGQGLSHIASLPLGNNRSVALVRAGRDVVLVGVAENSVTPIRRYSEAEALANGIELTPEDFSAPAPGESRGGGVIETLRRMTVRS
jgi:flagellar protein FliO/FliZ